MHKLITFTTTKGFRKQKIPKENNHVKRNSNISE